MLTPKELAFETCSVGEAKVNKKTTVMLVSAMLAGMYIAFGFYGFIVVASGFNGTPYAVLGKFLGALVFPVGIVLVIIAGSDLFTGNCLVSLGYMNKNYNLYKVLKNLFIVWIGNFIGALFFVFVLYFSKVAEVESIKTYIIALGEKKAHLPFIEAMMRGILCNIAVSLAVYISYAAKTVNGKIVAAFLPVFLFVVSGYEHSIANMFVIPFAKALGADISIWGIFHNLIPVTIGNIIGGSIIVPFSYYFIFVRSRK